MSAFFAPAAFDALALLGPSDDSEGLRAVLENLPADLPVPVLVASASDEGRWSADALSRATPLPVRWAQEGAVLQAGHVYVCPPRAIVEVRPRGRCAVTLSENPSEDRPLDRLLASLAVTFGARTLTVILGGHGRDGVTGALALRGAGGAMLVQASAAHTSELARALVEAGAAEVVMPSEPLGRATADLLAGRAPPSSAHVPVERRADTILERMADAYCVLDRDFRIRTVNAAAERLLGVPRASLLGRSHWDVFPASTDAPVGRAYRRVVEEGVEQHVTHHYTGEGYDLHLEVDAYPTDEGGVALFWRDVTQRVRAQTALRESEAKYRALFGEMDEAYAIVEVTRDAEGRWTDFLFLEVNAAFMRHTGMPYPVGRTATELLGTPNPRWAELYGRAAQTGESIRVEESELTLGRVFDLNIFRLGGDGSRRVAVLFTDVTERKRAEAALRESEERQAFLLELSDALRPVADPVAVEGEACRRLGAHLGVDRAYFVEVDEAAGVARVARDWVHDGAPSLGGEHAVADFGWSVAILRRGECHVVEDTRTSPLVPPKDKPASVALGIIACMGAPLIKEGRLVGALCVTDAQPRAWRPAEVDLLREVGERIWAAVERARAEETLRASEARHRALFESLDEGACLFERLPARPDARRDYRYVAMNAAMRAMFGIPDLSGQSIRDNFPDEVEAWYDDYDRVLDTGQPIRFERESMPQGKVLDMFVARVEDGSDKRLLAVMRDVTERKRLEERQAFLLRLGDALRAQPDERAIRELAVRMLAEHLHLDRCWISEVFEQQGISMVGPEQLRVDLTPMSGVYRLSDYPATMLQLATQPMVVRDAADDTRFSDSEKKLLAELSLRALLVAPLRKGPESVIWALAATTSAPRDWTDAERILLEETAERTWAAVERARAEAALVESEGRLRALIEHLPGGAVFVVDHDLRYVLAQGEALAAAGFTADDFTGRTVAEVLAASLVADHEALYRRVLSGEGAEVEHAAHGRVFLTRGAPLRNAAGDIYAALAVSYDITDRKRAEEDVRESEARLAAIFEVLPVGVGLVNAEGEVVLSNHEMKRFLPTGLLPSLDPARQGRWMGVDAQGRRVDPRDFPGARALRGEKVVPGIDMLYVATDDAPLWTRVAAVPLRDAAGRVTGHVSVVTDVNALKRAQEELRALNADLERRVAERTRRLADVNAELGNVITRTAHNLEAPALRLGRLLSAGPPLDAHASGSWTAEDAAKLQDEVTRLRSVARDLRELAKLERQDVQLEFLPLSELFAEVRASAAAKAQGERAYWEVGPLPIVRGDRALLRQAWEVLLTFTLSETRGARYVNVSSRAVEGEVQVTVEDDGLGLSGEEAATLFDLSVRTDQDVPLLEGSGLVQVRRILARHGGWAWAEAQRSSGKVVLAFPKDDAVSEVEALFRQDRPGE